MLGSEDDLALGVVQLRETAHRSGLATARTRNARLRIRRSRLLDWHPLEETIDGQRTQFYADAEAVLAHLPRRGLPMILRQMKVDASKPYSCSGFQKIVLHMRDKLGLPSTFTLDACRHGGMTELEHAELTDGQGRALSAHKSQQSYEGYAKRSLERALPATRKRYAHRLANEQRTSIQNSAQNELQNEVKKPDAAEG